MRACRLAPLLLLIAVLCLACGSAAAVASPSPPETAPIPAATPSLATPAPTSLPSASGCPAYPGGFFPVLALEVFRTPDLAEPAARHWYVDPAFGTCVVRVSDRGSDLSPDDPSAGLKNEYARVQSFNFTTNWGRSGGGEVETLMIVLPRDWAE